MLFPDFKAKINIFREYNFRDFTLMNCIVQNDGYFVSHELSSHIILHADWKNYPVMQNSQFRKVRK